MTEEVGTPGRIIRVNGPIVTAEGLVGVQMYEVVHVGREHLVGEVIRLDGETAVIQVYEDTGGLKPGQVVGRTGMPLSLRLGPGLIGNVYDGIQRPLKVLAAQEGAFIGRGVHVPPLDPVKRWHFVPRMKAGEQVRGGLVVGTVQETQMVEHRIMIPPRMTGTLEQVVEEGDYTVEDDIGVVREPDGHTVSLRMAQVWPARVGRPVIERLYVSEPLITGQRVIDTFFPIAKGGTAAIPGGFGTGKTMTQQALAKWASADIIVYVGCGERGNEMVEVLTTFPKLTDPRSGRPLMERTVLVANTSNMPVAAREVSIYTGITIAEYYRDMGYHVAVMADSTSRWAEALRELAARLEEMPAEEGFPAYLPTRLAGFYERAGVVTTLSGAKGSVSIVGAVSPPGGDFSEPVTQHTRRFIRCYWALDTLLANARHYPSIHWLKSYSEYIGDVTPWWEEVDVDWARLRQAALDILLKEDKLQQIVKLVGPDVLPDQQRLVLFVAELIKNGFLQQNAFDEVDMYSSPAKQVGLLRIMVDLYEKGLAVINAGAPLMMLRELACMQEVVRAKYTISNDDVEGLRALHRKMGNELDDLRRRYGG